MSERRFGWAAMAAFAWRQRRGGAGRTALSVAGLVLAALGFALAGSITTSASLLTQRDLARRGAGVYDLLVRPAGAVSPAERRLRLVAPDELRWGAGITLAQWRAIARLPGVSVAAPVAPAGTLELERPSGGRLLIPVAGIDPAAEARLVHLAQGLRSGTLLPAMVKPQSWLTPPFLLVTMGTPPPALLHALDGAEGTLGGGLLPPVVDDYVAAERRVPGSPVVQRQATAALPVLPGTATAWLSIGPPSGALAGVIDAARLPLGAARLPALPFVLYGRGTRNELPLLLTDVRAVCRLRGDGCISAVRVRVSAPAGLNARRAAVVAQVARAIERRTGLWVDITYGGAGRAVRDITDGHVATEVWTALGATLAISNGVNAVNLLLFALICAVALLYTVASSFIAALVRGAEHRILRHAGWPERAIRRLTIADTLLVSAAAGLLALLVLLACALIVHLAVPSIAVWLTLPLSMALYALGAALGAAVARWELIPHSPPQRRSEGPRGECPRGPSLGTAVPTAPSGGEGEDGPHPPTSTGCVPPPSRGEGERRPSQPRSPSPAHREMGSGGEGALPWWLSVAVRNQRRRPVRVALAVLTSATAAALFTFLLLGVTTLHGLLSVTLLGQGVAVELAPYHAALVVIAVVLAGAALADVAMQDVRERRPEIGVLRAVGCSKRTVLRLVAVEASLAGVAGGLLGVATAALATAWGYHEAIDGALLPLALVAAFAGAVALSVAGAIPPVLLATRIAPAEALRHEG